MHLQTRSLLSRYKTIIRWTFLSLAVGTLGCQQDIPIPTSVPSANPSTQWQTVLTQAVTEEGIDWETIKKHQHILEQYVAWVGTVGPQSNRRNGNRFPRRGRSNHKLVHWINAYNAWMIYSQLYHNEPADLAEVDTMGSFHWGQRVYIDGEYTSLYHVKMERILANHQDPRLHFMLYDPVENSPVPRFWTAMTWKAQANLALRRFFSTGKGAKRTDNGWVFHPMFKQYEDDFIDWSTESSVCDYLVEYTTDELQQWLMDAAKSGCDLAFFEPSTKIAVRPTSRPEGNSPSDN